MSILPLFQIIYGSRDAGINVFASDQQFNEKMKLAAAKLNLKAHQVSNVLLHSAADIEGHKGVDGRYYLLDFQRVFPPQNPCEGDAKKTILYNLLRPEFVANWKKPLSSDALSAFGKHNK